MARPGFASLILAAALAQAAHAASPAGTPSSAAPAAAGSPVTAAPAAGTLATAPAQGASGAEAAGFDGVVEAVRQTVVASQVAGAIVALDVKAGDVVRAGQVIARIDARAAEQATAASDAQVLAARAGLEVATREFERQKALAAKAYISQAALERAEAQYKATQAQLTAQLAQAGSARTQTGFYVVRAPYAGVVAEVPVALGDMAMPGRALATVYDPAALRVTVAVPQTAAVALARDARPRVELPGLPAERRWIEPARVTVLPTVDAATHTVQVRLDLPMPQAGVTPGMFARGWLPVPSPDGARVWVPASALVRRAELAGVYVVDDKGRAALRQVRAGRAQGDRVEILSGLAAGERVALDPQAAVR